MTEIGIMNFKKEISESDKPVLILFYGKNNLSSEVENILEKIGKENASVKCVKCDISLNQDFAMLYGVLSVPTIMFLKNGKPISSLMNDFSLNSINNFINSEIEIEKKNTMY